MEYYTFKLKEKTGYWKPNPRNIICGGVKEYYLKECEKSWKNSTMDLSVFQKRRNCVDMGLFLQYQCENYTSEIIDDVLING